MAYESQAAVCKMCGGALGYVVEEKRWKCKYCGTYVEHFSSENTDVDGIARQCINDVANRKMSSAEKNLSDCTRKNQKSVATLIASMSYYFGMVTQASSDQERRNYMDRLSGHVRVFLSDYPRLGPEETKFYNSFGTDFNDVVANLLSVFGVIGPSGNERITFLMDKIDLSLVYSEEENKSLLKLFINKGDEESVRKILSNSAHIDHFESLNIVLFMMKDSPSKSEMAGLVLDRNTALRFDPKCFDSYFAKTEDSFETCLGILSLLADYNIPIDAMNAFTTLSEKAQSDEDQVSLLENIYRLASDTRKDIEIFQYLFSNNDTISVIPAYFMILEQKDIYMSINSKTLISLLDNAAVSASTKIQIIREIISNQHFQMDTRGLDVVINHFLLNVKCAPEDRLSLAKALIAKNSPISSRTVTSYMVGNTFDGALKADIMRVIMDSGFKAVFAKNLFSEYINGSRDSADVKNKVTDVLRSGGYSMTSSGLGSLIVSDMPSDQKMVQISDAVSKGSTVPPDALENYIRSCLTNRRSVDAGFITFLIRYPFNISDATVRDFILYATDPDKARHLASFFDSMTGTLVGGMYKVRLGNQEYLMNFLQMYIICTRDTFDLAKQCADLISSKGISGSDKVTCGNIQIPFIKVIQNFEQQLTNTTKQLAEIYCKKLSLFGR